MAAAPWHSGRNREKPAVTEKGPYVTYDLGLEVKKPRSPCLGVGSFLAVAYVAARRSEHVASGSFRRESERFPFDCILYAP